MKLSFVHKSMINLLTAALAAVSLLASCVEMDDTQDAAVGYLAFPELSVDATVEDPMATKAGPVAIPAGVKVPAVSELTIVVTDSKGATHDFTSGSKLPLPVGTYTISASYGSNTFGTPYFLGTASGTIQAVTEETPSISVTMQNALVKVSVGAELAKHFTPSGKVSLTSGQADYGAWTYVPAGSKLEATLAGTNSAGVQASKSYTIVDPVIARTAYDFTADLTENMPAVTLSGDISKIGAFGKRLFFSDATTVQNINAANAAMLKYEVSSSSDFSGSVMVSPVSAAGISYADVSTMADTYYVRAVIGSVKSSSVTVNNAFKSSVVSTAHYNTNNELAGTNAVLDYALTGLLKELHEDGKLVISTTTLKRGGTAVRTVSNYSAETKMTDPTPPGSTPWPYLPQSTDGSAYTLEVSHTFNNSASTASVVGIVVNEPLSFNVYIGNTSYTSYDKYKSSGAAAANNCNGETIYDASASCTISSALMGNNNYSKTLKFYVGETEWYSSNSWNGDANFKQNLSGIKTYAAHNIKASVIFDGKLVTSGTRGHHVTGLPHVANPPTTASGWTALGLDNNCKCSWNSDHAVVSTDASSSNPGIKSPTFHVPENINITVNSRVKVDAIQIVIWYNNEYHVYLAADTKNPIIKQSSNKQTGKIFDTSGTSTLTTSNNYIRCISDRKTAGYPVLIYNVNIYYR